MRFNICATLLCTSLLFSGCMTPTAPEGAMVDITPQEVHESKDLERLKSLQSTLSSALIDKPELDYPDEYGLLNDLNQRIVQLYRKHAIEKMDGMKQTVEGAYHNLAPLPGLQALKEQMHNEPAIIEPLLPKVLAPIEKEVLITQAVMNQFIAESKRDKLGSNRRAEVYHYLFQLSGDSAWMQARDKQMEIILTPIRSAIQKGVYSHQLEEKIDFVRSIYRNTPEPLVDEMLHAYGAIYANRFYYQLNRDNPDSAYKVIQSLAEKDDEEAIKARLKPESEKMLEQFSLQITRSMTDANQLPQTYRWYQKALSLQQLLSIKKPLPMDIAPLAAQLAEQYKKLKLDRNESAALGVLYAIHAIEPKQQNLTDTIALQESVIYDFAVPRLEIKTLYAKKSQNDFSQYITNKLKKHLASSVSHDVNIVDNIDSSELASSPIKPTKLVFSGNILQAKVDASRKPNKKTLTVKVGQNKIPNPDFIAWLELPEKQRSKLEKPEETLLIDRQENIAIGSQLHRKAGVFAVSYRLTDVEHNKVIYPDSITLQKEFQDESNSVFEVGNVVIPAKEAKLPQDEEILDELVKEMALKIGAQLEAVLQNKEQEYLKHAASLSSKSDCPQIVDNLARALTIVKAKRQSPDEISAQLRDHAVSCLK